MKTIRQIANEIGVSKQAVQKRLKTEPLCSSIQPYMSTKDGTQYIDVGGENLIKSAYAQAIRQPTADNVPDNHAEVGGNGYSELYGVLLETVSALRQQLEVKDEQIKNKDEQILKLTDINKNLSESINAERRNELAETMGHIIDGGNLIESNGKPTSKKSFFRRFFTKGGTHENG